MDQKAFSEVEHLLLDSDSSTDEIEEHLSRINFGGNRPAQEIEQQLANLPPIQSLRGAAARDAIAAITDIVTIAAEGMDQQQEGEGAAAQHAQEDIAAQGMGQQEGGVAAQHAQEAIAAQSMNQQQQQQQLGQGWFQGNSVPPPLAPPAQSLQGPASQHSQEAIVAQGTRQQQHQPELRLRLQHQGSFRRNYVPPPLHLPHQQEFRRQLRGLQQLEQGSFHGMYVPPPPPSPIPIPTPQGAAAQPRRQPAVVAQGMNQQQPGQGSFNQFFIPSQAINADSHVLQAPHALQVQPAIFAQGMHQQRQLGQGSFDQFIPSQAINTASHVLQIPYALQAQPAIFAQGMHQQQQQQLWQGSFDQFFIPSQAIIADPHALQVQPAIFAQGMHQQRQLGQGSFDQFIPSQAINAASHVLQTSYALQAQPAIFAQGMHQQQQQLGQGSFDQFFIPSQAINAASHALQAPHALQAQPDIFAQGMHQQQQQQQQLGQGSLHQFFIQPQAINAATHATQASLVLQAQPAIAAQEPGSYYDIGGYVPPDLPPVPRIHHLIQECSQPFERRLTSSDVDRLHPFRMHRSDAERHILPMFNPDEDPKVGIELTMYDTADNEYRVKFKSRMPAGGRTTHVLNGAGWKQFVKHYGLTRTQDFVTLWMFRNAQTRNLCLAISWRRVPNAGTLTFRRRRSK